MTQEEREYHLREALESLTEDRHLIRSGRRLEVVIRHAIKHLKKAELDEMAADWECRINNRPAKLDQTSINWVLSLAAKEVKEEIYGSGVVVGDVVVI